MNTLYILLFGITWFIFAYYWYGGIIKRKVILSDDSKDVPSHTEQDGKDYVPTKPAILFGHHFSSIAGAGPIVGPILAFAYFGWLPALLWILIGSVFMGAVHDYTALMLSVRNKGYSIVEITDKVLSVRARKIFAVFVWITLMLVQAVFADLVAKTLVNEPGIAVPTIGIIFLAIFFGWAVFKKGANLAISTIIALIILYLLIVFGQDYPIVQSYHFWLTLTIIYAFIAAVLPVQVLLQPRDYLSVYILIAGMAIGFLGLMFLQPEMNAPAFISNPAEDTPPLFPILFITIACGAISGFHSLVSSGTSAKQLNKESDGKRVAYGSMLTEGALAMLVILLISSVLIWNPGGEGNGFVFQNLLDKGAILVFSNSLGLAGEAIAIPFAIGTMFGGLMLNAFILTTLDTSARLNRYVLQETIGLKTGGLFRNKFFTTALSLILAYFLCFFNGYSILWPLFGSSNQLIATLSLFVISAYLFGHKIPRWYTLIPASIMLIITESALVWQIFSDYLPNSQWHLVIVALILFILGLIIAFESYKKTGIIRSTDKNPKIITE